MATRDRLIKILKNWAYEDGEGLEAVLMSDVCADLADTLIAAGVAFDDDLETRLTAMTEECLKWHERAQDAAAKLAELETRFGNGKFEEKK